MKMTDATALVESDLDMDDDGSLATTIYFSDDEESGAMNELEIVHASLYRIEGDNTVAWRVAWTIWKYVHGYVIDDERREERGNTI